MLAEATRLPTQSGVTAPRTRLSVLAIQVRSRPTHQGSGRHTVHSHLISDFSFRKACCAAFIMYQLLPQQPLQKAAHAGIDRALPLRTRAGTCDPRRVQRRRRAHGGRMQSDQADQPLGPHCLLGASGAIKLCPAAPSDAENAQGFKQSASTPQPRHVPSVASPAPRPLWIHYAFSQFPCFLQHIKMHCRS